MLKGKFRHYRPATHALFVGGLILITVSMIIILQYRSGREALIVEVRAGLSRLATVAASLVDGDAFNLLVAPEHELNEIYQSVHEPLQKMLLSTKDVRFLYTCRLVNDEVFFVVDATPQGDADGDQLEDHSFLMDKYEDADPALLRALREGVVTATDKPYSDQWGSFMSGYAPIRNQQGQVVGVLGVDMTTDTFEKRLLPLHQMAWNALWVALIVSAIATLTIYLSESVVLRNLRIHDESRRLHSEQLEAAKLALEEKVNDLRRQSIALTQALQEAHSATTSKGRFVAYVNHEMRTPLTGITGMLELMMTTPLNDTQRKYMQIAQSCASSLLSHIADVLDLAKIESGKLTIDRHTFNLGQILTELTDMFASLASVKSLAFRKSVDPCVWNEFSGDSRRIRQVLMNLLSNALKFTKQGHIELRVFPTQSDDARCVYRFEVLDTGIGLSPESARKIFQPFEQADGSIERDFGGTGLGLVICKQLTELMGGTIGCTPSGLHGVVFWCTIPLLKASHRRPASHAPTVSSPPVL